jgi:hypothetical protein
MEASGFQPSPEFVEHLPGASLVARLDDQAVDGVHPEPDGFHVEGVDGPAQRLRFLDEARLVRVCRQGPEGRQQFVNLGQ